MSETSVRVARGLAAMALAVLLVSLVMRLVEDVAW